MARFSDFTAAIFDVDDTLLDNRSSTSGPSLHERSRLRAVHRVGKRHGIVALQQVTIQENLEGFTTAPAHTLESAVWNIMFRCGLVAVNEPDPTNQIFREIVALKDKLHEKLLREEGREVVGASDFVRRLAANGFDGKLAIASTAVRRDIDIFLEKVGLTGLFPDAHIIAKDRITHPKPHPEAFDLAFQMLDLPPGTKSKVLVFEDDPRGIMAAKAAGMHVFAIATRYDKERLAKLAVAPDFIAESYAEFANHLGLPATLKL